MVVRSLSWEPYQKMIKHYEKFRIPDQNKLHDWFMEVNWNEKDKKTNECKIIRVTFPNGKQAFIKKEHFLSVLFTFGDQEQQMKMVPQKLSRTRWYETVVSVKAKRDIKKGEDLTFPIKLSMPSEEEEIIGSLDLKKKVAL